MADRPIIFSAPMVRAILAGRKTQTRRVIAQPDLDGGERWVKYPGGWVLAVNDEDEWRARLPYAAGDRLWVREACRAEELSQPPSERPATKAEREKLGRTKVPVMSDLDGADGVRYLADDSWRIIENSPAASDRWIDLFHYRGRGEAGVGNPVPSIHMPRWASRLTLTVTEVRVQRLWDLTDEDAIAEGISHRRSEFYSQGVWTHGGDEGWHTPEAAYRNLWNSLHGPGAWDANPWVVAITFSVALCNIDQMPGVLE